MHFAEKVKVVVQRSASDAIPRRGAKADFDHGRTNDIHCFRQRVRHAMFSILNLPSRHSDWLANGLRTRIFRSHRILLDVAWDKHQ